MAIGLVTVQALAAAGASTASAIEQGDGRLEVVVDEVREVRAGETISLRVRYGNVGEGPFFLHRGLDIGGSKGLSITAKGNGCTAEVAPAFIEAPPEWLEYFLVPLLPKRSLVEEVRLNDLEGAFIEFPLRTAGRYELSVRFRGDPIEHHERTWSGVVQSSPQVLVLRPPAAQAVTRWMTVLEKCAAGDCREIELATKFFSVVRDDGAADLLAGLSGQGGGIMHALAAQGRRADVPALRAHARAQTVAAARAYYLDVVDKIERDDPCR